MNDPRLDPFGRALAIGLGAFMLFALLAALWSARASDVPPVIGEVRRLVVDVRRTLAGERRDTPREAQPRDGGKCTQPLAQDDIPERERVERVIASCSRRPGRWADPWQVLLLLRLEADLGVPSAARGLFAAIVCVESAMRSGVHRGDWRGGVARARGPFQLHFWGRALCGLTDAGFDDLDASARCYWSRVEARLGACDGSLAAAEALVASGRAGCRPEGSAHWTEMKRWGVIVPPR